MTPDNRWALFISISLTALAVAVTLLCVEVGFFQGPKLAAARREVRTLRAEVYDQRTCQAWVANLTRAAATVELAPHDPETHGAFSTLSANPPPQCIGA